MLRHSVLGLAVLYTVVLPAACQTCSSTYDDHHGCQTYSLNTPYGNKKCLAVEPDSADFSFYLKPGQDFNFFQVKVTPYIVSSGNIKVSKQILSQTDKWYNIKMSKNEGLVQATYRLSIDRDIQRTLTIIFNRAQKIEIFISGNAFFAPNCNPSEFFPPSTQPPTPRPPPPRSSPGRPSPDQAKDEQSTSTKTPAGLHPPQAPVITEDEEAKTSTENSPVDDSRKAPNNPGLPWYVPVIITAIVAVIIITIITFLVVRKMNQKKENKFQQKQEKQGKVNYSGPHCSPDQHYEEEIDLQDHIYEEVDDLGPVIYGHPSNTMDEGGVDVRVGGGRMANRGSAHESMNSLYVPFN